MIQQCTHCLVRDVRARQWVRQVKIEIASARIWYHDVPIVYPSYTVYILYKPCVTNYKSQRPKKGFCPLSALQIFSSKMVCLRCPNPVWPVAGLNFAYLSWTSFWLQDFSHFAICQSVLRALAGATWPRASTEETKTFKTDLMRRCFCQQKPSFNEGSAASFQEFQFSFACWYICYTHAYYTIRCYIFAFCSVLGFFNSW